MSKGFAEKRVFNGKQYSLEMHWDTKPEAESHAKKLRARGRLVKIISGSMIGGRKVYLIYCRFKHLK